MRCLTYRMTSRHSIINKGHSILYPIHTTSFLPYNFTGKVVVPLCVKKRMPCASVCAADGNTNTCTGHSFLNTQGLSTIPHDIGAAQCEVVEIEVHRPLSHNGAAYCLYRN